jgi:CRP-like cAMP-binding protein
LALIVFKKTYLAREKIYEIYHEASVVYIIKSGQVRMTADSGCKIVEAGNFFGEISLIKKHKYNCSAVVLKYSELYLIYRVKFDGMSSSNNEAELVIMRNLASIFAKRLKYFEI